MSLIDPSKKMLGTAKFFLSRTYLGTAGQRKEPVVQEALEANVRFSCKIKDVDQHGYA
jgi:hypothetical protein